MGEEKIELDERTLVFIHEKLREARYEIKSLTDAIIAEGLKSHSNHQEGDRLYQLVLAEVKRVEGDDYSRNGRVKFEGVEHEPRKRLDSHEEALVDALLGDGWRVTEIRDRFEREGRTAGFNWRSVYDAIRARTQSRPRPYRTCPGWDCVVLRGLEGLRTPGDRLKRVTVSPSHGMAVGCLG
jgi:hypothetical protein